MKDENYQTITMIWNEIAITIRHNPNWLSSGKETYGEYLTHTEIRSDDGKQLPMTETGYRSHFTMKSNIDEYRDVRGFVKAWLDEEGKSKKWKAYVADQAQLKLF